ncbi:alpha/beta fold hydrolase [Rhodococcus sp. NPDC058521]|uniref:alpha/beta fold hydrolase n=1 Tax=Rhodococcus sp. NPDC058521 TaxID=3346536 RepID=UPI0036617895
MARHDYVLVPGAWMAAWVWQPITDRLTELGHVVHAVTLTGLDGGSSSGGVGLVTHVDDVLQLLHSRNINDAIVVGHSYAGMVAGMVADRAPERVAHTVFVDSNVPRDGRSMLDAFGAEWRRAIDEDITAHDGFWSVPDMDVLTENGMSVEQAQQVLERCVPHPGATIVDKARMRVPVARQRATYINCTVPDADFRSGDIAALTESPTWDLVEVPTGHWPMVTAPQELSRVLASIS